MIEELHEQLVLTGLRFFMGVNWKQPLRRESNRSKGFLKNSYKKIMLADDASIIKMVDSLLGN